MPTMVALDRSMASRLPYPIRDALIQACGRVFWFRDSYRQFLLSAGVPAEMYDRYSDQSKYKIARLVLGELDMHGDDGYLIEQRIVTEFCKLRNVPEEAPDRDAAINALRHLKELAVAQKEYIEEAVGNEVRLRHEAKAAQQRSIERTKQLEDLATRFTDLVASTDQEQARGYALESILSELFALAEIPYRKPYRTATEQIDGHFTFRSFDYLVESRWRKQPPNEADLSALKIKADKKITSTRGLFVSVAGFRREVVDEFTRGVTSNLILMDGSDLMMILEERVSLVQALEYKIQKAAQEGLIYVPMSDLT